MISLSLSHVMLSETSTKLLCTQSVLWSGLLGETSEGASQHAAHAASQQLPCCGCRLASLPLQTHVAQFVWIFLPCLVFREFRSRSCTMTLSPPPALFGCMVQVVEG